MKEPSDYSGGRENLREKIIGLGERSIRKSYYPKLQQQLAELERFRALLDQSRDAILLARIPSWNLLDVNDSACRQLNFSRHDLLSLSMPDLVPAAAWDEISALFSDQSSLAEDGLTIAASLKRREGEEARVEMTIRRVQLSDGAYAVIVARDILERERAERALQESERKYRSIFENAIEGIFQTTSDGRGLSLNPALARMLGYDSPEELLQSVSDIARQAYVDPDDRKRFIDELDQHGSVEGFETQFYRKDGGKIWASLNARAVRDTDGRLLYYEGSAEDTTRRKQIEEELLRSHAMYRTIFDNSGTSMIIIDQDATIILCNEECVKLSGYAREEIEGKKKWTDFIHEEDLELMRAYDAGRQADPDHTPRQYEFRIVDRSGSTHHMINTVATIPGTTLRVAAQLDITDLKHSEAEKTKLQSQLLQSQKMEAIGTLAGGIAHDFNNILTVITGFGTLLRTSMGESDPLQRHVDQILSSSEKAVNLTQGLLAFSRRQPISLAPLDMNNTIKSTEKLLKRLLTEDIELRTLYTGDDTVVMADKTQMDQILFNLVTNARDAMPKGGTLTVRTEAAEIGGDFIRLHGFGEPGRYVRMTVSDTGTGMDETTRKNIFDPFFTTKEVGKGTGLGLATVYGIVKQHGGYITVDSTPGGGSSFHVYFPAVTAPAAQEEEEAVSLEGGSESILVAEDNEGVRHFIRDLLVEYGYEIIEAADGQDAVDRFTERPDVDLVILDSVMPRKNGLAAYEDMRKTRPNVRALFTSGYTKDVVLDKGIQEKDLDFIAKPLSPAALLQKVREILGK